MLDTHGGIIERDLLHWSQPIMRSTGATCFKLVNPALWLVAEDALLSHVQQQGFFVSRWFSATCTTASNAVRWPLVQHVLIAAVDIRQQFNNIHIMCQPAQKQIYPMCTENHLSVTPKEHIFILFLCATLFKTFTLVDMTIWLRYPWSSRMHIISPPRQSVSSKFGNTLS